jgi:hypothetical protein
LRDVLTLLAESVAAAPEGALLVGDVLRVMRSTGLHERSLEDILTITEAVRRRARDEVLAAFTLKELDALLARLEVRNWPREFRR